MTDASIVARLIDDVSPGMSRMEDANRGFNTTLEATQRQARQYTQRLNELVRQQSRLQTGLSAARRELREAERAFQATGEAADSEALESAYQRYNQIRSELTDTTRAANDTRRALYNLNEAGRQQASTMGGSASSGSASGGILARLGAAGATAMVGQLASQTISTLATSFGGDAMGNYVGNALSSAGMGAAIGSAIAPGVGTAIGAALGGLVGIATGYMEEFADKDESFKSYVQDAVTTIKEDREASIQNGSSLAAQREQDVLAFDQLLGSGVGASYLEDVRRMGASTPMTYEGLTNMSRALAPGFGDTPERMLELMTALGDAGSAVGIDEAGMAEMAKSMSRMESSGKATLEYLNIFQDRGVDVIGILSDGLGKTQAEIYDMISKGKIGGVEAVQMIQNALEDMYGGAMEQQSKTFAGLSSTLEDMQNEIDAASGEGYNDIRKKGMEEQIAWLESEKGQQMKEINYAMGAFSASLENQKEEMIRDALDAVYGSQEYQDLMADGSDEAVAKAGEMLAEAKVQAINEYNASEGAQLMVESELSLIEAVRSNTELNDSYWNAGYLVGQEYSKGRAAAIASSLIPTSAAAYQSTGQKPALSSYAANPNAYAYGLKRVPYNNYPALLHEGERVLTAAEARSDSGGGSVQIAKLADQIVVREEADIDRFAAVFVDKLQAAMMTGVA